VACGGIGYAIASAKNRSTSEGVLLGVLLGVIGVLIELCLPKLAPQTQIPSGWYPDPANPAQQRYWNGAQWAELPPKVS
jgi:hypothetical protein